MERELFDRECTARYEQSVADRRDGEHADEGRVDDAEREPRTDCNHAEQFDDGPEKFECAVVRKRDYADSSISGIADHTTVLP